MSHYSEFTSIPARRGGPSRGERRSNAVGGGENGHQRRSQMGRSFDEVREWDRAASFAAGLAIGLTLGAGVALLVAPRTGEETRELLGERTRHLGDRMAGGLDEFRDDLHRASRRSRRKLRRGLTRGRWLVEDVRG